MKLVERAINAVPGTILAHNLMDAAGRRALKKGTRLTAEHVAVLAGLGRKTVTVAVLEAGDVHEDEAAVALGEALRGDYLRPDEPSGGRVNLHATADGLLEVNASHLLELNLLPGITLATRRQGAMVGPGHETDMAATLKIIPYAVPRQDLDRALSLARSGLLALRPLRRGLHVALLVTGEPSAQEKVSNDFAPPTRARVERLGAELVTAVAVPEDVAAIRQAVTRLAREVHLVIIAGQTSIMDEDDTTLRALREAGAEGIVYGAPVEPGNLIAVGYFPATGTPVLCAPGCARSPRPNVVDLVLPRLLAGERLGRAQIAELGLGGLLGAGAH